MQLTLDETGFFYKIVADEVSYPGFRFISHLSVKKNQIDNLKRRILTEGVAVANELSR